MSNIVFRFGRRIKLCRTQKKLSQERLAELSGLHPTYIGQIERGEKNCTLETAEKIADGLGIPLTELLHDIPPEKTVDGNPAIISEIEHIVSQLMKLNLKQLSIVSTLAERLSEL